MDEKEIMFTVNECVSEEQKQAIDTMATKLILEVETMLSLDLDDIEKCNF